MARIVFLSFLFFTLMLQLTAVTGLLCHCDFCPGKNSTCETDGYCLSLTWLQRETGIVHHAYRCLDKKMFFPAPYPIQCTLSNVPNVEVKTACCNSDMCNLQLKPKLDVSRAGWFDRPRTGTLLANNNDTRPRTAATGTKYNFINSTDQLDE